MWTTQQTYPETAALRARFVIGQSVRNSLSGSKIHTRSAKEFLKGKTMTNQNLSVIDMGVVLIGQPSVTSGMKHAENAGN